MTTAAPSTSAPSEKSLVFLPAWLFMQQRILVALRRGESAVVVAPRGAGLTSFLRLLLQRLEEAPPARPLYIDLGWPAARPAGRAVGWRHGPPAHAGVSDRVVRRLLRHRR